WPVVPQSTSFKHSTHLPALQIEPTPCAQGVPVNGSFFGPLASHRSSVHSLPSSGMSSELATSWGLPAPSHTLLVQWPCLAEPAPTTPAASKFCMHDPAAHRRCAHAFSTPGQSVSDAQDCGGDGVQRPATQYSPSTHGHALPASGASSTRQPARPA